MNRFGLALQYLVPLALGAAAGYASLGLWQTVRAQAAPPSLALIQPSDGSTVEGTVSVSATASDAGLVGIRFQVNGVDLGPEITTGSCTAAWDTTTGPDGEYTVTAVAHTGDGLLTQAPALTIAVANQSPDIFGVNAWNISAFAASITWQTSQSSDSQIDFGPTSSYGVRTALDSSALTTHTQILTGLSSATTYHYRVSSRNALGKLSTSGDLTFSTAKGNPFIGIAISDVAATADQTTATIVWMTDQLSDSSVDYGPTIFAGSQSPIASALVTVHTVTLTGLTPGKTYFYRVRSRNVQGRESESSTFRFTTAK